MVRGLVLSLLFASWAAPIFAAEEASDLDPFRDILVDATAETGLDFTYWNGMTGERYVSEVLGGGGVLFDYDHDGDLDLFAVQGHLLEPPGAETLPSPVFPPPAKAGGRLFRNRLTDGEVRFEDVTESSRLVARGYGMGAVAGDVDNDGWPDLYVLNHGPNQLWRNRGDGTFEDVTATSGTGDPGWSTAAVFFDYDADGFLDLFVGNYLDFRLEDHRPCRAPNGLADYCGPASYTAAADRLLRNRGDGTFEDVTARSGLGEASPSPALGAVTLDVDLDGRLDLFVANDGMANHLWRQVGGGRFEETALFAGCAVNADGVAEASMGVDAGDVDGDGDEDLFMAHLDQETNTLYLNDGEGFFEDASDASGLALGSFPFTGFGSRLVDLDNDSRLDVVVVNGAIKTLPALARGGDPYPLHQPDQVFRNVGGGRFLDATGVAGDALEHSAVSRGLAAGDLDGDGDVDLVVFDNASPARVLLNRRGSENGWIGLEVWDAGRKRPALGSRVGVFVRGRSPIWRRVGPGGSYASGQDPRLVVGLGPADSAEKPRVEKVRVEWHGHAGPGDVEERTEEWTDLEAGRYHRLEPGTGRSGTGSSVSPEGSTEEPTPDEPTPDESPPEP